MNKQRWMPVVLSCAMIVGAGCRTGQGPSKTGAPVPTPVDPKAVAQPGAEDDPLHPRVRMATSLGEITFELNAAEAAAPVLNFVHCVQSGLYDGTIFHRVLKESMIQGGGYTPDMEPRLPGEPLPMPDDWRSTLSNERGTIALIRGRRGVEAGSAQFFVNVIDNPGLDGANGPRGHAVLGRVVAGVETVERIRNIPVGPHDKYAAGQSVVVPISPVVITSVRLLTKFDSSRAQAIAVAEKAAMASQLETLIEEIERDAGAKVVTTNSGLRYVDFEIGKGPTPLPTDTVEFHYRGILVDGTEFESTLWREATVRPLDGLIAGLREGLTTMNEGGRRTLIIPPELGYRSGGIPGRIPPNATLIFDIELLAIK